MIISTPGKLIRLRIRATCARACTVYSPAANAQAGHEIRVGLLS